MTLIPIIHPNNKVKIFINFLVLIAHIFEFFYIPFHFSFGEFLNDKSLFFFQMFIFTLIFFDILITLSSGYYDKGLLKLSRHDIKANYFKNHFWSDFTTLLPLIIIELLSSLLFTWNLGYLKSLQFLFLIRMKNLDKMMRKNCERFAFTDIGNNIINIIKMSIWVFFLAHFFACLMNLLSNLEEESSNRFTDIISENNTLTLPLEYLSILYWVLATMLTIGYGDLTVKTKEEKILNIITMIFTCCMFMTVMNKIGEIIDDFKKRAEFLNEKIACVNQYLDQKTGNFNLKLRVKKYLEYVFGENQRLIVEGQEIVSNLSNSLKMEIFQVMNSEIIEKMPILNKNFSWSFLKNLTSSMCEVSFSPEDFIIDVSSIFKNEQFLIRKKQMTNKNYILFAKGR